MTPIWYGYAKRIARSYIYDQNSDDVDAIRRTEAVEAAIRATEAQMDGKSRMDAINMVLLRGTHTAAGASILIPASERTINRWTKQFVLAIGEYLELP